MPAVRQQLIYQQQSQYYQQQLQSNTWYSYEILVPGTYWQDCMYYFFAFHDYANIWYFVPGTRYHYQVPSTTTLLVVVQQYYSTWYQVVQSREFLLVLTSTQQKDQFLFFVSLQHSMLADVVGLPIMSNKRSCITGHLTLLIKPSRILQLCSFATDCTEWSGLSLWYQQTLVARCDTSQLVLCQRIHLGTLASARKKI